MKTAFIFPGQGSQQLGMLKEGHPVVLAVFAKASEVLNLDLWQIAQEGPVEALNNTVNTQPILLAAGVALWQVWLKEGNPKPALLAGHSLGEYTALVCSEALTLEDGIRLVANRGKFMQEAVPMGQGAMAAVLGLADADLQAACEQAQLGQIVSCVNFNAIGQTVIAGHHDAVVRACELAKEKGAKKVVMLPVSVPSHCELMLPAARQLETLLQTIPIKTPQIPIIHNVDVAMHSDPDDIRQALVKQLYCPVRWVETIQRMAKEGVQQVIECGPGKVLSGLVKRIDPNLQTSSLDRG